MIARLRQAIVARHTRERLAALAAGASAATPLSVSIDLGPGEADWLSCLPGHDDYWYWARPAAGDWRLALGSAQQYETAGTARFAALHNAARGLTREARRDGSPELFFGFAFDAEERRHLPNARLVLPALLLRNRQGRCDLTLSTTAGRLSQAEAHWLGLLAPAGAAEATALLQRLPDPLADRAWLARVQAALRDIAAGPLDKVVLARTARLQGNGPLATAPLLASLLTRQPGCTIYAHGSGHRSFLGATPETLVRLAAGRAEADALAGTAWLAPADRPAPSPLSDDKNRREQILVEESVRRALHGLCSGVDAVAPQEILHLRQLSHLRTRLAGHLRPGVSLFDLAAALHPTPAVGGSPGAAALDWLRRHDEQRGAWYSGGLGWIDGAGDGEIVVALRCAFIAGQEATLWAGAGIVAGSDPEQELAETEAKLQAMLEVFHHPARSASPPLPERTGTQ